MLRAAAVVATLSFIIPSAVHADNAADSRARAIFKRGEREAERGRHRAALAEFLAAFAIVERAAIAYNVAHESEILAASSSSAPDDAPRAILFYQKYLALDAAAPDRQDVLRRIAILKQSTEPPVQLGGPSPATPPTVGASPESVATAAVATETGGHDTAVTPPRKTQPEQDSPVPSSAPATTVHVPPSPPLVEGTTPTLWLPVGAGALALASAAGAAGLHASAAGALGELNRSCAAPCPAPQVDPVRYQYQAAISLWVVAGVAAAADVGIWIWWAHGRKKRATDAVTIVPVIGDGLLGLCAGGQL